MIKDFPFLSLQRSFGEPDMEILSVILEVMVASEIDFKPLSGVKPKLFSSMEISETYDHLIQGNSLRISLYFNLNGCNCSPHLHSVQGAPPCH